MIGTSTGTIPRNRHFHFVIACVSSESRAYKCSMSFKDLINRKVLRNFQFHRRTLGNTFTKEKDELASIVFFCASSYRKYLMDC